MMKDFFKRVTLVVGLLVVTVTLFSIPARAQSFTAQIQNFWNQLSNGLLTFAVGPVSAVGTSSQTYKAGGLICSTVTANCSTVQYTDAGVQNQWNVMSVSIPAKALITVGDELVIDVTGQTASNANAKVFQLFLGGTTCSGTASNCCSGGKNITSDGLTLNNVGFTSHYAIDRSGASTQWIGGFSMGGTTIGDITQTTGTITDTAAIPLVWCARNTAASALTMQGTPVITVHLNPQ